MLTGKSAERYIGLNVALEDFSREFDFAEENDRAVAIVGPAFIDTILEYILREFLISDEKEVDTLLDRQLSTFSSKIAMAYCLGLIPKVIRDDLRLVAKVRNRFAHELKVSFEEDKIRSWCIALKWHRQIYMEPPADATARDLFQVGIHQIVMYLTGVVGIARYQKRETNDWDRL